MEIMFVGCGDAFGSGGRFNTCFLATGRSCRFLIDCGASSMVALKHHGVDPNTVDGIVVSHLHGDHFGGIPFFLIDAVIMSKRQRPFFLMGPRGLAERLEATQEALFPSSSRWTLPFALEITEMTLGQPHAGPGFRVTPHLAAHSSGAPSQSLRIEMDERVVAFSGDTGWTETLFDTARDADLFLCECSYYQGARPGHLDYVTLAAKLPEIGAKRVILTHMDPDMLSRRATLAYETSADGMVVEV
jgi:ribonuclease BN (tRNA processing enzyme)